MFAIPYLIFISKYFRSFRLNATFIYSVPIPFNGTNTTGVIGALLFNDSNFAFNSLGYNPYMFHDTVDVTNSFERLDICVIVPKTGTESILYNLMRTLSPLTWSIVIASLFFMVIAYQSMQKLQRFVMSDKQQERSVYSWPGTLSINFQSFFGDSITRLPTSFPMRWIVVCWCIYSFLICTAFTANLISSLVQPKNLPDFDTLEELGSSNLKIIYPNHLNASLYQFLKNDKRTFTMLQDQMMPVNRSHFYRLISTDRRSNAYVMTSDMVDDMVNKNLDGATGMPFYHRMKEALVYLPKVYLLEYGSPYLAYVNEMLGRFNEMGFMVLWNMRSAIFRSGAEHDTEDGLEIKVVLQMKHLQAAFYLWAVCLTISAIVFAVELWYFRRSQRQLNRVRYFDRNRALEYGCRVD